MYEKLIEDLETAHTQIYKNMALNIEFRAGGSRHINGEDIAFKMMLEQTKALNEAGFSDTEFSIVTDESKLLALIMKLSVSLNYLNKQ